METVGTTYDRLISHLDAGAARYRIISHVPEGRTDAVSLLRGHPSAQALKCIVVMIKTGKKNTHFVLAIVPGDRRVNLEAIRSLRGGTYAGFAPPDRAAELAGSEMGTVLPFALDPRLELIADSGITVHSEVFFNAARLDRSIALDLQDYLRLATPRLERIAQ